MASRTVSGNDAASDRKRLDLPALQHFDERRGRRRCKKLLPPGGRIVGDAPVLRNDTIEQRKTGKGPLEIIQLAAGHPQQSSTGCLQPLKRRIGRTIHLAVAGDRSVIVGGECQEIQSPSLQAVARALSVYVDQESSRAVSGKRSSFFFSGRIF
jgi:hypothetical protein